MPYVGSSELRATRATEWDEQAQADCSRFSSQIRDRPHFVRYSPVWTGVNLEHHPIAVTKPFVTSPVRSMIQFMLLTECRPSEAVALKWSEIDTTKAVWTYCPKHHKTKHKGKNRVIVIGPQGQQVLNGIREMSRSDFVFDPQVGFEEFVRKAYGDKAKARTVGNCYTKHGLNTAVRTACDKAGIPRWSPGQLRKTRATQARRDGDLETAQQILGHSSKQTTERHYADVDLSRAEANALQFG